MNKRKRRIYPIAIIIVGLLLVFSAVTITTMEIREDLEKEMQMTLGDVASQNVLAVQNEIMMQYKLLLGCAEMLQNSPGQEKSTLAEMEYFVEQYDLKRMGYMDADGMAYTTDGYTVDLKDRIFFQKSMEGIPWITAALKDRIGEEQGSINVFSVPVYDTDGVTVKGVVFATYPQDIFRDMMDINFFNAKGFSCIVMTDGRIIAHSKNSPIEGTDDFFEHLTQDGNKNRLVTEQMRGEMEQGESGYGSCEHRDGTTAMFCYVPINDNEYGSRWYMVAIAPWEVMDARMEPIMRNVHILTVILLAIAGMGVAAFVYLQRTRSRELECLAYEDSLTGGYNFAKFREMAKSSAGVDGYVIAMDLTDFKLINSNFGTHKGDETLLALWRILRADVGEQEMVARVDADRFVLFLRATDKTALGERLDRLIKKIEQIPGQLNIPSLFPVFGIYYSQVFREADKSYGFAVQAKHLVKERRDRHYAFYDEIDYQRLLENKELEDSFDEALASGEFEVWYQPKYSAASREVIGAEALVRWRRADGRMLPPGIFIPLFEKNGCISVLDEYVFRKVCERQRECLEMGKNPVPVSVNISRVSLYFDRIVERYETIRKEVGLDVKYVQLEITESATVDNVDIGSLIEQFHELGFQMLLDDFGSGYSALASLNTMRFDTLKLDKSLIDYIGDSRGEKLLKCITRLGRSLGFHITAEGVEREEQVEFLKDVKCDDIQGYYFSKPLPLEEYETLIYG